MLLHGLVLPSPWQDVLRTLLCAFLPELARCFSHCAINYIRGREQPEPVVTRVIVASSALIAVCVHFFTAWEGIYVFVIVSALIIARMIVCAAVTPGEPTLFRWTIGLFISGLGFLAFKSVIPFGVVWGHLMVTVAVFFAYQMAQARSTENADVSDEDTIIYEGGKENWI